MLTIKINPNLYKTRMQGKSVLSSSQASGITYPTFRQMVLGIWFPYAMQTLSKFLTGMGFTPDELRETRFGDVFDVKKEG